MNAIGLLQNLQTAADQRNAPSGFMADIPVLDMLEDPGIGIYWHRRFHSFKSGTVNAANAYWAQGLNAFGSADGTITNLTTQEGGVALASTATDNAGASISQACPPFRISRAAKTLWFEARVKTSTIADTKHDLFVGLMDTNTALSATVPITAAGAVADVSCVGFFRPESAKAGAGTGGATLNVTYKAAGVAAVVVANDVATLLADTYVKLGMRFDQRAGKFSNNDNALSFFVDGVKVAEKVIPVAAGTDFPNNINLGFFMAVLNATATTPGNSSISSVTVAQLLIGL
jgi:hypothetical protein